MQDKLELWTANLEQAKTEARQRTIEMLNKQADTELERRKVETRNLFAAREAELQAQQNQVQVVGHVHSKNKCGKSYWRNLKFCKTNMTSRLPKKQLRLKQIGGAAAELQFAQEELSIATNVLTKLRDRHAAIRTERQRYGAVRTLAVATMPKMPDELFPWKQIFPVSGAFFALPFLLGWLWEQKIQRVTDITAVEKSGSLAPIIGEVAKLPAKTNMGRNRRVYEESVERAACESIYVVGHQGHSIDRRGQ